MKIKIDVTKSIYEQSWWPSLKPEAKLKVLKSIRAQSGYIRLSMRRGKRIFYINQTRRLKVNCLM